MLHRPKSGIRTLTKDPEKLSTCPFLELGMRPLEYPMQQATILILLTRVISLRAYKLAHICIPIRINMLIHA